MKDKPIDIINRMEIFLSAIYQDAQDTKNSIIFSYDPSYPRFLKFDATNLIKTLENICKFFLYSTEYTDIYILFQLKNYSPKSVHFDIKIKSSHSVMRPSHYYLSKINDYLKKANESMISHNDGEFLISFSAVLTGDRAIQRQINIKNQTNTNILVACDDDALFDTISAQINFLGLKVIGKNDLSNLMRHIKDSIFTPFVIFIDSKILKNEAMLEDILEFKNIKNFRIVAICKSDESANDLPNHVTVLKQPFSTDSFQLAFKNSLEK